MREEVFNSINDLNNFSKSFCSAHVGSESFNNMPAVDLSDCLDIKIRVPLGLLEQTIEGSIIKDFKKFANKIPVIHRYKTFVILGTRFSGKTTLMKQMYNHVVNNSMFIFLREPHKDLTVENLLKFIETKMDKDIKYIYLLMR